MDHLNPIGDDELPAHADSSEPDVPPLDKGSPWSMPPPAQPILRSSVGRMFTERREQVFGMTRRFSMRATMLLVALAAVCLSVMRSLGMPAAMSGIVLLVMIAAAVGQVFLFGGKDPRLASVISGAVAMAILLAAVAIREEGRRLDFDRGFRDVIQGLLGGGILGGFVGYGTGALVARVFLLLDMYDKRRPKRTEPARKIDPLADD